MSEVTNTWSAALEISGAPMNGIEMGEKFMSVIGGSAPKKDYVTNSNETADGVQYDDGDNDALTPKLDERQLTLPFYISGTSQSDSFDAWAEGNIIRCNSTNVHVYTAAGLEVLLNKPLPQGLYIVSDGKRSKKINIR